MKMVYKVLRELNLNYKTSAKLKIIIIATTTKTMAMIPLERMGSNDGCLLLLPIYILNYKTKNSDFFFITGILSLI